MISWYLGTCWTLDWDERGLHIVFLGSSIPNLGRKRCHHLELCAKEKLLDLVSQTPCPDRETVSPPIAFV